MSPIWIFPFGFGFVGTLYDRVPDGVPLWTESAFFLLLVAPAFFWSSWRAWKPVMNEEVPVLHGLCFVALPYLPLAVLGAGTMEGLLHLLEKLTR